MKQEREAVAAANVLVSLSTGKGAEKQPHEEKRNTEAEYKAQADAVQDMGVYEDYHDDE